MVSRWKRFFLQSHRNLPIVGAEWGWRRNDDGLVVQIIKADGAFMNPCTKSILLTGLGTLVIAALTSGAARNAASPADSPNLHPPVYPLKVSDNRRYLVDQSGTPFLIVGDTPQGLMGRLSEEDAAFYFADREAHGFNTLGWIDVACAGNDYPTNIYAAIRRGLLPETQDDFIHLIKLESRSVDKELIGSRWQPVHKVFTRRVRVCVSMNTLRRILHNDLRISNNRSSNVGYRTG